MKSQEPQLTLSIPETTSIFADQSVQRNCSQSVKASHICCSKVCTHHAYICESKSCPCHKNHKNCPHLSIESVLNIVQSKFNSLSHYQDTIIAKIDKTIDELSDLKDKVESLIRENPWAYGFTNKDRNLYNALNQQKITGSEFTTLFHEAVYQVSKNPQKDTLDSKFAQIWKSVEKQVNTKSAKFIKLLQSLSSKQKLIRDRLLAESKITMSDEDEDNLWAMFGEKTIIEAKLLYRASENNFQVDKFHQKCDNFQHTLTLCETNHSKVIGGYTPLTWNNRNGTYIKDESGDSFIFSLTNNDKFTLDRTKDALYPYSTIGPTFGNGQPDFYINNQANTQNSYAQIGKSYVNPKYHANNGESYSRFTGNPDRTYNYLAREWEVWQLTFAEC